MGGGGVEDVPAAIEAGDAADAGVEAAGADEIEMRLTSLEACKTFRQQSLVPRRANVEEGSSGDRRQNDKDATGTMLFFSQCHRRKSVLRNRHLRLPEIRLDEVDR